MLAWRRPKKSAHLSTIFSGKEALASNFYQATIDTLAPQPTPEYEPVIPDMADR